MKRLLTLGLLGLSACDEAEPVDPDDPCVSEPALTWENFGKAHMDKHCNGCHSSMMILPHQRNDAPPGIDFNTYDMVVGWGERAYVRGVETMDMPPGGGPSPEELANYEEWMLCEVLPDAL
jgi:uncharacterized membrane protein